MSQMILLGLLAVYIVSATQSHNAEKQDVLAPYVNDAYDEQFIPFDKFLYQVQHATYEDYSDTNVRDKESFYEMKGHILKMYEGVRKPNEITSFVLDDEYGDCIPILEQPGMYHQDVHQIPQPPTNSTPGGKVDGPGPGNASYAQSPLTLGLTDQFGNSVSCPDETIPMARLTLEKLTRFPTLNGFFDKKPPPAIPEDFVALESEDPNVVHLHAIGYQWVTNYGGNSWINLWNPAGDFSISQQWYLGIEKEKPLQSVEGGLVMDRYYKKKDQSLLFVFYTADGYKDKKCWNLDCGAFSQINKHWFLGGPWDHYSAFDKEQWGFEMQWKLYNGLWWLFLKGPGEYDAVGYYNTSVYEGGRLSKSASIVEYGGEVANYTGGTAFPEMGSGAFAEKGWRQAAFQNTVFWIPRDEDDGYGEWANLTALDTGKSSCYTIDIVGWPDGGDWGAYFYFGGPGGNLCAK